MTNSIRGRHTVDLRRLHAVWAANYAALMQLLPRLREPEPVRMLLCGMGKPGVEIVVVERGPYTAVLEIRQRAAVCAPDSSPVDRSQSCQVAPVMPVPCEFRLRVYHDARMAEVIGTQGHRYLKPRYDYPNRNMYQRNEKYQVNCLLGEWLKVCLVQGAAVPLPDVLAQGG